MELKGFVKNMFNGDVEIKAIGDRSKIEELIKEVMVGPRGADVRDIKVRWIEFDTTYADFYIM